MITHNSVHMVKEVFVSGNIVGVVSADHLLDYIRDECHLLYMMNMMFDQIVLMTETTIIMMGIIICWCSKC